MSAQLPMPQEPPRSSSQRSGESELEKLLGGGGGNAGGPTRTRGEGEGPSAIITRLVREAGYDDTWPVRARDILEGMIGSSIGESSESRLVDIQDMIIRSIFAYNEPETSYFEQLTPGGLVIYQEDTFRSSAAVLFDRHADEVNTRIASFDEMPQFVERLRPDAFEFWRANVKPSSIPPDLSFDDFVKLARVIPIPIVMGPAPVFELTGSNGRIQRGDGLQSDLLTTVGMRAFKDEKEGFLTVAHAIGDSGKLTHKPSGVSFDLNYKYFNDNWPAWDVAFIRLGNDLAFSELNRDPVPVSCILASVAPGRGQFGTFHGAESGKGVAVVEGADFILPHIGETDIGRFYTAVVTQPGDSGAVLVDDNGAAMGMAYSQTKSEHFLPMSVWMYMPGVLAAAGTKIMQPSQSATV